MVQVLAITDYIDSLAEAETRLGLSRNDEPSFFTEWSSDLPELTKSEKERLDLIKQRYLYHRQYGHLLEGVVNFIVRSAIVGTSRILRSTLSVAFRSISAVGNRRSG